MQSIEVVHDAPLLQRVLHLPPQSTLVSSPSCMPFMQTDASQSLPMQAPSAQSSSLVQLCPLAHLSGQLLPQSLSDSVPFGTPSEQEGR